MGHQIESFGNQGNNSVALIFGQINNWLIVEAARQVGGKAVDK